jgi:hypothetical protein
MHLTLTAIATAVALLGAVCVCVPATVRRDEGKLRIVRPTIASIDKARHAMLVLAVLMAVSPVIVAMGPPALRVPAGAVATLIAPGAAVISFARTTDVLDQIALVIASSLMILVLAGGLMLAADFWYPEAFLSLLAVIAAPLLTWHGLKPVHPRQRSSSDSGSEQAAAIHG